MAYTYLDEWNDPTPIRFIGEGKKVHAGWTVFPVFNPVSLPNWVCDPCNPPSKRFEVTYESGSTSYFHWYQVILSSDTNTDILVKLDHAARVHEALEKLAAAEREYKRLVG